MVIHRIKDMMELSSSVKANKRSLAAALGDRLAPGLRDGEALPDLVLTLELAVRAAQAALDRLVALDDEADDAEVDLIDLRDQRRSLVDDELHPRAAAVRGAIDLAFGKERGSLIHHMKGRTRRHPAALERQVARALYSLSDPERRLPAPENRFAAVDREGWVRALESPHRRLVALEQRISQRDAALTAAVVHRKAAMREYDAAYGDALRWVAAAFRLARFDLRAIKKLKPYYLRRRLSQRARKKREARAAQAVQAAATEAVAGVEAYEVEEPRPLPVSARARLSKTVAKWLDKRRLFGT